MLQFTFPVVRLSLLLSLIAFVLLEPKTSTAQPTQNDSGSGSTEIKILSWNIWMLPPFIKRTKKRQRGRKIGELLQNSDYDMIVFQEAFHPGSRRKMKRSLIKTFPHKIGPAKRNPVSIITNSGIMIYSKLPMEKLGAIRFKLRTGVNRMSRKGALLVESVKDGQKFQVLGTHLNAGGKVYVKISQVGQLNDELLEEHKEEGVPQVICGDFNIHRHKEHRYELMMNTLDAEDGPLEGDIQFTSGIRKEDDFKVRTGHCAGKPKFNNVIDYIFYKGHGKEATVKRRVPQISEECSYNDDLSDHQPVEAIIKLK